MSENKLNKISIVSGNGNESNKEFFCDSGAALLDVLNENNIFIDAPCGGKGTCGKCKVKVNGDKLSNFAPAEEKRITAKEKREGYRLACQTHVYGDVEVVIGDSADAQIQSSGREIDIDASSPLKKVFLKMEMPNIEDQRDDHKRIADALGHEQISITVECLKNIPRILRESNFEITVVHNESKIIKIEQGNTVDKHYGIAVDIGTTTVVAYLMDLNTGKQVDVVSALNAQKSYGGDVISRINYTIENEDGLQVLSDSIVEQLNDMARSLTTKANISLDNVYGIFIAGNTTMMHLLCNLPPRNIAASPFVPVTTDRMVMRASHIGLNINKYCVVGLLPSVSGYVGADIVAAVLSSDLYEGEETCLLIDIGTNGEIALGNKEGIVCCSTAAGPAFEGAQIRNGIGGITGAINTVKIVDDKLVYTTILDQKPIGICGSGIIDAMAVLVQAEIIDETGRLLDKDEIESEIGNKLMDRIVEIDGSLSFVIAHASETKSGEEIIITQKDVREVQLAKAALAAGINVLIKRSGRTVKDVDKIYLAGGFGSFIDKVSAVKIGLLPSELEDKIVVLGNAAGTGAVMSLISETHFSDCDKVKAITEYIELSTSADFQDEYVECMYF